MNNKGKLPASGASAEAVIKAARLLNDYLTGRRLNSQDSQDTEDTESKEIEAAVSVLIESAPEKWQGLYLRLLGDDDLAEISAELVCGRVSESLVDYAATGEEAARRWPETAAHLAGCPKCQERLASLLEALAEHGADWLTFSKSLEREPPGEELVLRKSSGWTWSAVKEGMVRKLGLEDVDLGLAVGALRLTAVPEAAISFSLPDDALPPLSLIYELPEQLGRFRLDIKPKTVAAVHAEVWELEVELEPGQELRSLEISIGSVEGKTESVRSVKPGHQREHWEIRPPMEAHFWLHLAWLRSGARVWKEQKIELPLRYET